MRHRHRNLVPTQGMHAKLKGHLVEAFRIRDSGPHGEWRLAQEDGENRGS